MPAKTTLMDLLPGLIGLTIGSVSPQAGRAGANTLEMMDAFKQRRRRQGIEEEQLERARVHDERSAQQFEWAKERDMDVDRERVRTEEERVRAANAWGETKKQFAKEGIELLSEYANWVPDTEEQVGLVGKYHRELKTSTPMSWEAAEAYSKELAAKGEVMYANVRTPDGVVVRRMLGRQASSRQDGTAPPGAAQVTGSIEGLAKATENLALAKTTLESQEAEARSKAFASMPDPDEWAGLPSTQVVRAGEGPVTVPRYTTAEQRAAVGKAEIGTRSAQRDVMTTGAMYPELMKALLPMLAQFLGGAPVPQGGSGQPTVRPEMVQSMVDKYGR